MQNQSKIDYDADDLISVHPIIDLHCDMLHYLVTVDGAHPDNKEDIGCAIPYLEAGNVCLQVMAISAVAGDAGKGNTQAQCRWFNRLLEEYPHMLRLFPGDFDQHRQLPENKINIIAAVENASGLCEEDEPLDLGFRRLDQIIEEARRLFYVSLTHHGENRFGGGNNTKTGLKADGRSLLEYLAGKRIAIDLSHTSDALASGIIDHIEKKSLRLPIMASHSNFRAVYDHPRNLPDELAREIIRREGLIGMNFLRAFMHPADPNVLIDHIVHGYEIGGWDALCFGADFFYTKTHPDRSRVPFYFAEHEHAGKYQDILRSLPGVLDSAQRQALAHGNATRFLQRLGEVDIM